MGLNTIHEKVSGSTKNTNKDRDSSVGIATGYGLDGPGIESQLRGGPDFPHPSKPALGTTQPPIQWVPGLSWRQSGRGVALINHLHLEPRLKKE